MESQFRSTLPPIFVHHVISLCGERGEQWLDNLPSTISALEKKWRIKAGESFLNLTFNYVATATLVDGTSAVIKIGLPVKDVEIFREAAYLKAINGNGAVRLFAIDLDYQAILIERVVPGASLKSVFSRGLSTSLRSGIQYLKRWLKPVRERPRENDSLIAVEMTIEIIRRTLRPGVEESFEKDPLNAVSMAIAVMKQVLRPAPQTVNDFSNLDDWFGDMNRSIGTDFPQDLVTRVLDMYAELRCDRSNIFLLHGDLHHDNILVSQTGQLLAIDPIGVVGHLGYEIAGFLISHYRLLASDTFLREKLDKAIAEFAVAFEIEELVIRKWAFCQMVFSWWWRFDNMPETFSSEVNPFELWKV